VFFFLKSVALNSIIHPQNKKSRLEACFLERITGEQKKTFNNGFLRRECAETTSRAS
jgi:hypothetical protein